ncbi:uncharacterized protein LOC111346511, partial [Stylophora pistillata]|uniref:uncharacterized protein LOC111346511 n=1 Tax=Stylophora pistillata TaxID=50429 RepID=UPI000C047C6A
MDDIKILVEFGVSKKVLTSSGEHHEVINVIKTAFNIKEEIFLQKFDQDWQEYIDFPEGKFENKARVKVILKPNKEVPDTPATATPSSTCTISTTGNPLRQEAQVQATLLINNGKIQVGPKAKVCDIKCATLIDFGKHILGECVVELGSSYKRYFPLVKYKAEQAVRKLLQMPVTIVQMTLNGPGSQRLYVLETLQGVDICRVIKMAEKCFQGKTCFESGMSREVLKDLCTLASSESDRLLIKYACCKGQNLSKNKARNLYGFSDFHKQESRINSTLEEFKEIRDAVDTLAKVQDKAVLEGFGLTYSDDDSAEDQLSSSEGTDCEWISEDEKNKGPVKFQTASADVNLAVTNKSQDKSQQPRPAADPDVPLEKNRTLVSPVPSMDHLLLMLRDNTLNWFAFVAELRMLLRNYSEETLVYALTEFSDHLENMDLTVEEKESVEMSRQAYLEYERQKAMGDDAWVSESDSDTIDPDSVVTDDLNEQ